MIPAFDPAVERWFLVAGWTALVVLWHTTLVALGLAAWRAWRHGASARAQYVGAAAALIASVLLAAVTPIALMSAPSRPLSVAVPLGPPPVSQVPSPTGSFGPVLDVPVDLSTSRVATVGGVVWLLGSLAALVRLAGGWTLARWIRRRATPVHSEAFAAAMAGVRATWHLPPAALLASAHVEAPVVLGHRAPAILLPRDAAHRLDVEAMTPLIAHELAHVARRDYAANLAQSVAEALLFFSPGVHWISRRVREAREYCCDDLVVAQCGPRPYVEALTRLAGLGAAARARPVLNVAGPRLIVRIRRLLQEDSMTPFPGYRVLALVGALALAATAGVDLVPVSAAALAQGAAPAPGRVPIAFPAEQEGSSVAVRSFRSTETGVCGTAEIQNRADVALVSVRFAAVLSTLAERQPQFVNISDEIPVDVWPGATATVGADLLAPSALSTRPVQEGVQASCMLAQARFANGHVWHIEPVSAQAIDLDLRFPHAEVPRAMVGARSTRGTTNVCLDDQGRTYSEGAVVGVRHEPGRFARCVGGRWDGR